jgi:hypothetical protein
MDTIKITVLKPRNAPGRMSGKYFLDLYQGDYDDWDTDVEKFEERGIDPIDNVLVDTEFENHKKVLEAIKQAKLKCGNDYYPLEKEIKQAIENLV